MYGDAGQNASPGINPSHTTLTLTLDATLILILDAWPFDYNKKNRRVNQPVHLTARRQMSYNKKTVPFDGGTVKRH